MQHLFVFRSDTSLVKVQISDRDQLSLPIGLESLWSSGSRTDTGSLEINLRYIAFGKNINSGSGNGNSEILIRFPLSIQP
jgi:type 1 fimbria pilin